MQHTHISRRQHAFHDNEAQLDDYGQRCRVTEGKTVLYAVLDSSSKTHHPSSRSSNMSNVIPSPIILLGPLAKSKHPALTLDLAMVNLRTRSVPFFEQWERIPTSERVLVKRETETVEAKPKLPRVPKAPGISSVKRKPKSKQFKQEWVGRKKRRARSIKQELPEPRTPRPPPRVKTYLDPGQLSDSDSELSSVPPSPSSLIKAETYDLNDFLSDSPLSSAAPSSSPSPRGPVIRPANGWNIVQLSPLFHRVGRRDEARHRQSSTTADFRVPQPPPPRPTFEFDPASSSALVVADKAKLIEESPFYWAPVKPEPPRRESQLLEGRDTDHGPGTENVVEQAGREIALDPGQRDEKPILEVGLPDPEASGIDNSEATSSSTSETGLKPAAVDQDGLPTLPIISRPVAIPPVEIEQGPAILSNLQTELPNNTCRAVILRIPSRPFARVVSATSAEFAAPLASPVVVEATPPKSVDIGATPPQSGKDKATIVPLDTSLGEGISSPETLEDTPPDTPRAPLIWGSALQPTTDLPVAPQMKSVDSSSFRRTLSSDPPDSTPSQPDRIRAPPPLPPLPPPPSPLCPPQANLLILAAIAGLMQVGITREELIAATEPAVSMPEPKLKPALKRKQPQKVPKGVQPAKKRKVSVRFEKELEEELRVSEKELRGRRG